MDILSAVRGGQCSVAVLDKLKDRCRRPLGLLDGILPTKVRFLKCASAQYCQHVVCASILPTLQLDVASNGKMRTRALFALWGP